MIHKYAYLQFGKQKFDGICEMDIKVTKVCCLPKRSDKWRIEMKWRDVGDVWAIAKLFRNGHRIFGFFYENEEADPEHKGKTILLIMSGKVEIEKMDVKVDVYHLGSETTIVGTSEHLEWNGEDPDAPVKVKFD